MCFPGVAHLSVLCAPRALVYKISSLCVFQRLCPSEPPERFESEHMCCLQLSESEMCI